VVSLAVRGSVVRRRGRRRGRGSVVRGGSVVSAGKEGINSGGGAEPGCLCSPS